jgi:hypothetical protein
MLAGKGWAGAKGVPAAVADGGGAGAGGSGGGGGGSGSGSSSESSSGSGGSDSDGDGEDAHQQQQQDHHDHHHHHHHHHHVQAIGYGNFNLKPRGSVTGSVVIMLCPLALPVSTGCDIGEITLPPPFAKPAEPGGTGDGGTACVVAAGGAAAAAAAATAGAVAVAGASAAWAASVPSPPAPTAGCVRERGPRDALPATAYAPLASAALLRAAARGFSLPDERERACRAERRHAHCRGVVLLIERAVLSAGPGRAALAAAGGGEPGQRLCIVAKWNGRLVHRTRADGADGAGGGEAAEQRPNAKAKAEAKAKAKAKVGGAGGGAGGAAREALWQDEFLELQFPTDISGCELRLEVWTAGPAPAAGRAQARTHGLFGTAKAQARKRGAHEQGGREEGCEGGEEVGEAEGRLVCAAVLSGDQLFCTAAGEGESGRITTAAPLMATGTAAPASPPAAAVGVVSVARVRSRVLQLQLLRLAGVPPAASTATSRAGHSKQAQRQRAAPEARSWPAVYCRVLRRGRELHRTPPARAAGSSRPPEWPPASAAGRFSLRILPELEPLAANANEDTGEDTQEDIQEDTQEGAQGRACHSARGEALLTIEVWGVGGAGAGGEAGGDALLGSTRVGPAELLQLERGGGERPRELPVFAPNGLAAGGGGGGGGGCGMVLQLLHGQQAAVELMDARHLHLDALLPLAGAGAGGGGGGGGEGGGGGGAGAVSLFCTAHCGGAEVGRTAPAVCQRGGAEWGRAAFRLPLPPPPAERLLSLPAPAAAAAATPEEDSQLLLRLWAEGGGGGGAGGAGAGRADVLVAEAALPGPALAAAAPSRRELKLALPGMEPVQGSVTVAAVESRRFWLQVRDRSAVTH